MTSKIEWTGETWNPIVGCSIVSPGCTNCYAMKMASRILNINAGKALAEAGMVAAQFLDYGTPEQRERHLKALSGHPSHYDGTIKYVKDKPVWTGKVALAPEHILLKPLSWKKPRTIFVNSMGDLFHEDVPDEWIDRVFAVMALCPQHTFQVLTKRSARMLAYLRHGAVGRRVGLQVCDLQEHAPDVVLLLDRSDAPFAPPGNRILLGQWPLPNVWLGVSAERQKEADERIPDLLNTPAAVRFVSAEPLLGSIDFERIKCPNACPPPDYCNHCHPDGGDATGTFDALQRGLDWIIVGGESGPGARPMHPDWARSIRDQCAAAGVPFFFKQHGSWGVTYDRDKDDPDWRRCDAASNNSPRGQWLNVAGGQGFHGDRVVRVEPMNKTRPLGRHLDGRTHDDMPGLKQIVEAV